MLQADMLLALSSAYATRELVAGCGFVNQINLRDNVRCKACGYRILYKARTDRRTCGWRIAESRTLRAS